VLDSWHTSAVADEIAARRLSLTFGVSIVGGLLLGPVDLLAQKTLPYPWANLANSPAVWAIAAFALGAWVRAGRWQPAAASTALLVVAVESYYAAATLVQKDNIDNLWTPSTLMWLGFGVLAGVIFGTGGAWSHGEHRWRRIVGTAMPGAVFLMEAAVHVLRRNDGDAAYRTDNLQTALICLAIALLLPFVVGQNGRQRVEGLLAAVPLALLGVALFYLVEAMTAIVDGAIIMVVRNLATLILG